MPKADRGTLLTTLTLSPDTAQPLHRQLYHRLRALILDGTLRSGTRLPSTRTLARDLSLSRNTVANAFDQLVLEGFVVGRVGDGTYVASPEHLSPLTGKRPKGGRPQAKPSSRPLSRRGAIIASTPIGRDAMRPRAFAVGVPAIDAFPIELWSRLLSRRSRRASLGDLCHGDPAGFRPLREAIATYLATARGVSAEPGQVLVLSSSQQALDIIARVLVDPGEPVWLEDPGYLGARGALTGAGARIVPVPVDGEGLAVSEGIRACRQARLACVTPSHQFPLGSTLSLARRFALLRWAEQARAWIIEDDYDSEFRYRGRPLASLAGLDAGRRVIYVGTFTKVMFPSLRLAYLVAPPDLVEPLLAARSFVDRHSPTLPQIALADFIQDGHFTAHLRRMRALYRDRQEALLEATARRLAGLLALEADDAGMHLVGRLPARVKDLPLVDRAARVGLEMSALSRYFLGPRPRSGLVLGYAGVDETAIREGVEKLARVLEPSNQRRAASEKSSR